MSEPVVAENLMSVIRWLEYLLNAPRDAVARAFVTMDLCHYQIQEGNQYTYPFVDSDVDIAAPKYILIRTPDTTVMQQLTVSVGADDIVHAELYENPTVDVIGDIKVFINRNRRSSNVTTTLLYEDPTISVDNVLLAHMEVGGAGLGSSKLTGETSADMFVLARNQDYVIKITATADNTHVNIQPDLCEVTPL